ncbi:MAG: adenosylmethionine--8-amino-7-oxononanoate transaminase [Myxococcota bacterium]|nr:adenosylmethionine--8-amino-7-oxononanoate transaminase [Myxococcota bacterium]
MSSWIERDRAVLWHPFTQHEEWFSYDPIVVERAEGFELIDTEGRRYLDGVSSLWCNVHGHGHPDILDAMREQLDRVQHSTMLGLSHTPAIELAERLVALTPEPLTRVFFSDAGATAVEVALRMAFQYWRQVGHPEKTRFITLTDGYHGDTIGSVSLGFSEPFHTGYEPITFRTLKFDPPWLCAPITGNGSYDAARLEAAAQVSLAGFEQQLEQHARETAAVFIEPLMQGAAGMWPQPASFVRRVRELCDVHEVLLVCDEVATGFGRTGTMFAIEQAGISPDILCLAKGLTAGYLPVAATLATESLFEAFNAPYAEYKALFHGHTYGGNPLGCAAAIANLDVFEREDTLGKARKAADALGRSLALHIDPLAHTSPVRRIGTMVGFDMLRDAATGERYPSSERRSHHVALAARDEGVIVRPLGDSVILMPPLAMPPSLVERVVEATARAVARVTAA